MLAVGVVSYVASVESFFWFRFSFQVLSYLTTARAGSYRRTCPLAGVFMIRVNALSLFPRHANGGRICSRQIPTCPYRNALPAFMFVTSRLQDNYEWNRSNGSKKGWRYNPKVLRWAVYALNRCGSSAYEVLREVLHLPDPSHVRRIGRKAAPLSAGIQHHNIKVSSVGSRGILAQQRPCCRGQVLGCVLAYTNSDR